MNSAFPTNISTTGFLIDNLFWLAFWLITVAFAAVIIILIVFIFRYHARPGHKPYYTHGNTPQALALTIGLALAVFFLIDVNLAYHDHKAWDEIWGQPPDPNKALYVQVMPEQFAWNIRYHGPDRKFNTDDDIVAMNELHIPINKPVIVQLKSKDVIHSFFLPNVRIKQDAVPGLVTSLYFEANKKGTFDIACAEHCGLGHYRMKGFLIVESEEEVENWLAETKAEDFEDTKWGWNWTKS